MYITQQLRPLQCLIVTVQIVDSVLRSSVPNELGHIVNSRFLGIIDGDP